MNAKRGSRRRWSSTRIRLSRRLWMTRTSSQLFTFQPLRIARCGNFKFEFDRDPPDRFRCQSCRSGCAPSRSALVKQLRHAEHGVEGRANARHRLRFRPRLSTSCASVPLHDAVLVAKCPGACDVRFSALALHGPSSFICSRNIAVKPDDFPVFIFCGRTLPKEWVIPYNLACYCAQTGRLDECEAWFKKAMSIDEQAVKQVSTLDPGETGLK